MKDAQNESASLTEEQTKYASKVVTDIIEPQFNVIIKKLNDHLKKQGIIAGVDVQWFFDKVTK